MNILDDCELLKFVKSFKGVIIAPFLYQDAELDSFHGGNVGEWMASHWGHGMTGSEVGHPAQHEHGQSGIHDHRYIGTHTGEDAGSHLHYDHHHGTHHYHGYHGHHLGHHGSYLGNHGGHASHNIFGHNSGDHNHGNHGLKQVGEHATATGGGVRTYGGFSYGGGYGGVGFHADDVDIPKGEHKNTQKKLLQRSRIITQILS